MYLEDKRNNQCFSLKKKILTHSEPPYCKVTDTKIAKNCTEFTYIVYILNTYIRVYFYLNVKRHFLPINRTDK